MAKRILYNLAIRIDLLPQVYFLKIELQSGGKLAPLEVNPLHSSSLQCRFLLYLNPAGGATKNERTRILMLSAAELEIIQE